VNLTDKVKPYVIDDLLILGFADKNYQEIAVNWVRYINKLDIKNYVIIALDDEAFDYLNKHKINVVICEGSVSKKSGSGWKWRMDRIRELVDSSINVIHSDLDAVWLRNPLGILNNFDIVASSVESGFPTDTRNRWGFTICMGWIFYRATKNVSSLLCKIFDGTKDYDDQTEFNNYLSSNISLDEMNKLHCGSREFKIQDIDIKILNSEIIKRGDYNETALVCHPMMKKKADCKTQLKRRGLWCI
tara:strand:+ start:880 stop:1614 length:735 start_codon:yes stop_codon:yes gene_type:complete